MEMDIANESNTTLLNEIGLKFICRRHTMVK